MVGVGIGMNIDREIYGRNSGGGRTGGIATSMWMRIEVDMDRDEGWA